MEKDDDAEQRRERWGKPVKISLARETTVRLMKESVLLKELGFSRTVHTIQNHPTFRFLRPHCRTAPNML